jgi:uncharacterized protein YbjT (DUF2867 family)
MIGRREHFGERIHTAELSIVEGNVSDHSPLVGALRGHDAVFHLAANSDIARAASDPLV